MSALSMMVVQAMLTTQFVGRFSVYLPRVTSTMDVAREEAEADAPEGLIVVAEEQTQGRGRRGRGWVSPPGENVYVTAVLRPEREELRSLGMIAPLAVCATVESVGVECRLKWPNDILVGGKKVAGVLIDASSANDRVHYALVGIGINVNFDPGEHPELKGMATSLSAETGREVSREEVLAALLNEMERLYLEVRHGGSVASRWKELLETLGRRVQVRLNDMPVEGGGGRRWRGTWWCGRTTASGSHFGGDVDAGTWEAQRMSSDCGGWGGRGPPGKMKKRESGLGQASDSPVCSTSSMAGFATATIAGRACGITKGSPLRRGR
jgi:BirA family biotin operon repressor/biotin-[acetyl-CoA-carboxylase] ligase